MTGQDPSRPVSRLKGVGPRRADRLAQVGIHTVRDLLWHLPRRYERRSVVPIGDLLRGGEGAEGTVQGVVRRCSTGYIRGRLSITRAQLEDDSGQVWAVWFNQSFMQRHLEPGRRVIVTGRVRRYGRGLVIAVRDQDLLPRDAGSDEAAPHSPIHPVYPRIAGLGPRTLRQLIRQALGEGDLPDYLPAETRHRLNLSELHAALREAHFPSDGERLDRALARLGIDELLLLQLSLQFRRQSRNAQGAVRHVVRGGLTADFAARLPFVLTSAQSRAIAEVADDMAAPRPMHRLLQGDVGCGKTVVALWALLRAVEGGYQAALMAPTEILARQHYATLKGSPTIPGSVRTALLTGSVTGAARERLLDDLAAGRTDIVVGTHAVLSDPVRFGRLGLVVIDEQHRFGVRQRGDLAGKGRAPDVLVISATPIPRSLALTIYGDLDVSIIDELPPGRLPLKTWLVDRSHRSRVYRFVRRQVEEGGRAFVVCPLVEESERVSAVAAVRLAHSLARGPLRDLGVGLVHGRMEAGERQMALEAFAAGRTPVLVATSVIEVGVDVPAASVVVVEGAERFGLAQLHQLRGRVGRSDVQGHCILVCHGAGEASRERLRVLSRTGSGFEVAEADLRLRGPGQFFGTSQHGLPELRAAALLADSRLLALAREEARRIASRRWDPKTGGPLRAEILARFGLSASRRRSLPAPDAAAGRRSVRRPAPQ